MAHICTLKNDATMDDIAKIDKKLHKFMDDENIRGFRQILLPLMAVGATYDYIAFDFMDWEELVTNGIYIWIRKQGARSRALRQG